MSGSAADSYDLDSVGEALAAAVERALPAWMTGHVARIADAWGRLDSGARCTLDARAATVGAATAHRVAAELRALFAVPVEAQRTTPLAVVRAAVPDLTVLLHDAGIPPIERDPFDEQAFPDDDYGCTPASLVELGDDELGPLQLAWGLAKAHALRSAPER